MNDFSLLTDSSGKREECQSKEKKILLLPQFRLNAKHFFFLIKSCFSRGNEVLFNQEKHAWRQILLLKKRR